MKFLIFIFSLIIFHPLVLANSTQDLLNKQDNTGRVLLHHAVTERDLEKVKILLKKGADPNIKDDFGRAPLHYAMFAKQPDIFLWLLEIGANPNVLDVFGKTLLHIAIFSKRPDLVRFLLANGADLYIQDRRGYTPLDYAKKLDYTEIAKLIKDSIQGKKCQTPFK